jgi:hypothetical protein
MVDRVRIKLTTKTLQVFFALLVHAGPLTFILLRIFYVSTTLMAASGKCSLQNASPLPAETSIFKEANPVNGHMLFGKSVVSKQVSGPLPQTITILVIFILFPILSKNIDDS